MSHRLQITLDDELYEALLAEARLTGASLAELVRRSVSERLGTGSVADRRDVLRRTAGVWRDRDLSGVEIQAATRRGLLERAHRTIITAPPRRTRAPRLPAS